MNEKYMEIALTEAKKAYLANEIPVGAVIVYKNKVIAQTHNLKNENNCILFHAELSAIKQASIYFNNWRLTDCSIYITLEPCPMCASAIKQARIKNVYYGVPSQNETNSEIVRKIFQNSDINSTVEVYGDILKEKCLKILQDFFKKKRKNKS
ncbi:MAG: nucleoside deaminase [Bacilli bacterium]